MGYIKKGQVFDLYQEGRQTTRCMAINDSDAICLETLEIIKNIDFEHEVEGVLIEDIFKYE